MKSRLINIFWGIVLVGAGTIFYLRELELINFEMVSSTVWAALFGVAALFFLLTYFIKGVEHWGWLFPALTLAGVALTIFMAGSAWGNRLTGIPILLGIAAPFLVAYALDPRARGWALIPAWVMVVLTAVIFLEGRIDPNLTGAVVLFGIALPFLLVYLHDATRRWALIPFAILATVGTIPLLETFVAGPTFDLLVVGLLALPFFVVFLWSRDNWWALIPAGVFTSIVLTLLVERQALSLASSTTEVLMGGTMMGGLALTFGVLWLLRSRYPTGWAIYPAAIMLAIGGMVVFFGNLSNLAGPVMLIAAGVIVMLIAVLRKPK